MGLLRAAVWGSPIAHSLSPVLHRAAYDALGLADWTYDRRLVDETGFAAALAELDNSWRGLSLTMPLKEVALAAAVSASDRALVTGSANTLVPRAEGWYADNTDVPGLVAALVGDIAAVGGELRSDVPNAVRADTDPVVVLGAGATARSALAAVHQLGARRVVLQCRTLHPRTAQTAEALGLALDVAPLGEWPGAAGVVISTVPPDVSAAAAATLPLPAPGGRLIDVVYGGGPGVLCDRASARGYAVVPGTEMLLHQAIDQVLLMTGLTPPAGALRTALWKAMPPWPTPSDTMRE